MPDLTTKLEAILFVAEQPVELAKLAKAVECTSEEAKKSLVELDKRLADRGISLLSSHGSYQLVTNPKLAPVVERYIGQQFRADLSRPALETLAIVAYRQPVTKAEIESVRGVSSEQTIKNLLMRGLIIESGQSKSPGQPKLYRTGTKFLQALGLSRPDQLPALEQSEDTEEGR